MERTVKVWGKPIVIEVERRSKTVWVATGTYMGETITVQDRTANTALKRWQEAATYQGNSG